MKKHYRLIKLSLSLILVLTMCMTRVYGISDTSAHSTDQTFISDGGEYSLAYLLSHYSVFTFGSCEASHD